jgi:hypothetical protein
MPTTATAAACNLAVLGNLTLKGLVLFVLHHQGRQGKCRRWQCHVTFLQVFV